MTHRVSFSRPSLIPLSGGIIAALLLAQGASIPSAQANGYGSTVKAYKHAVNVYDNPFKALCPMTFVSPEEKAKLDSGKFIQPSDDAAACFSVNVIPPEALDISKLAAATGATTALHELMAVSREKGTAALRANQKLTACVGSGPRPGNDGCGELVAQTQADLADKYTELRRLVTLYNVFDRATAEQDRAAVSLSENAEGASLYAGTHSGAAFDFTMPGKLSATPGTAAELKAVTEPALVPMGGEATAFAKEIQSVREDVMMELGYEGSVEEAERKHPLEFRGAYNERASTFRSMIDAKMATNAYAAISLLPAPALDRDGEPELTKAVLNTAVQASTKKANELLSRTNRSEKERMTADGLMPNTARQVTGVDYNGAALLDLHSSAEFGTMPSQATMKAMTFSRDMCDGDTPPAICAYSDTNATMVLLRHPELCQAMIELRTVVASHASELEWARNAITMGATFASMPAGPAATLAVAGATQALFAGEKIGEAHNGLMLSKDASKALAFAGDQEPELARAADASVAKSQEDYDATFTREALEAPLVTALSAAGFQGLNMGVKAALGSAAGKAAVASLIDFSNTLSKVAVDASAATPEAMTKLAGQIAQMSDKAKAAFRANAKPAQLAAFNNVEADLGIIRVTWRDHVSKVVGPENWARIEQAIYSAMARLKAAGKEFKETISRTLRESEAKCNIAPV